MGDYVLPLILALSSLPAFVAAKMMGRGRPRGAPVPPLARLMRLVGVAIVAGALGLLWAGGDETRRLVVIVAMVVAVNGLGLLLLFKLGRKRPGPR
ncbi:MULTISPECIES: hypothetical protein [unclassified Lysobacter]|uniref:hypothetical protein n=1 Tax=unclassified Lysobacter TaxID=2635362 RepID=UPI001C215421|nr:hypothetical protein [Lysobacter sp. MMG2]MBU8975155.1 hypothetical protein [Lysobacter sp. MMG2]